jgi:UDP-2,3-diacylglucosamine hydrolase
VDFISDIHLHPTETRTHAAWTDYLQRSNADALFILGDLFEVWVGDDVLNAAASFESQCASLMKAASQRMNIFCMVGNRDFLLGPLFARLANVQMLPDTTVLQLGSQRIVLSHGDAWCLEDTDYQLFRKMVRAPEWQTAFLARPLQERQAIAKGIRAQSEERKHEGRYADADTTTALGVLHATGATRIIHGHTHQPATHTLAPGLERWVLSDWHLDDFTAPRAQVLRLESTGKNEAPQWHRLLPAEACQ